MHLVSRIFARRVALGSFTNPSLRRALFIVTLTMVSGLLKAESADDPVPPVPDQFDYCVGAQHFISTHHTANGSYLVEGARILHDEMGSNMIKFDLSRKYINYEKEGSTPVNPNINSLVELARDEPSYQEVFRMPFAYYIMWTYPFSTAGKFTPWHGHMDPKMMAQEYKEMYDLTCFFLTKYNKTGKTFLLGNWEGDWHLLSGAPKKPLKWLEDVNPDAVPGMIDWLNNRQKAVDDAKRDTPHQNVQVYLYVEVNLVQKSIKEHKLSVTQDVIPQTNVDFISYSSYDSTNPDKNLHVDLPTALSYMQSKLKPKPGLPDKRVFIGEYSCLAVKIGAQKQDAMMRDIIATSLDWGTPFVIYWQIFDNIKNEKPSIGCWLINNEGVRQPVFYTYQNFYKDSHQYIADYRRKNGTDPSLQTFQKFAVQWFKSPETSAKAAADAAAHAPAPQPTPAPTPTPKPAAK